MTVTPKLALVALCAAALATTAMPGNAKKKPASRAKSPITVTTSRVERSLAGVRLGTRLNSLFKQFGSPTEIQLGGGTGSGTGDTGSPFGGTASPFGGGGFPTGNTPIPGGNSPITMPGGPPMPGGPSMSGSPTLPLPGGGNVGGEFPGAGGTGTDATANVPTATYIYRNFNHHKGLQLDIQVDADGRVIQIIGTSLKPVPGVTTARGIGFGSQYISTTARYGVPESMTMANAFIQASFQEKAHVAFQFLNQKVVRIVIAEVD